MEFRLVKRAFIAAVALASFFGLCASARGQESRNPFLPPNTGTQAPPPAAAGPLDSIEVRGILSLDDKTFITLFNTGDSKSFTVQLGETMNNITVTGYELEGQDDMVTLESGGKTRRVPLKKAQIVAMATPPANAVPLPAGQPPGGQQPGAIAQPQSGNMPQMSDEEVRQRMQRVAEEIRRRRAVRRDALEKSQQNGT
ncbi:MAG: hypothetical protein ACREIA_25715, partial [Opitutaceae bacterium]